MPLLQGSLHLDATAERGGLAVDLTPVPLAEVGSEVTLWGNGPDGSVLPIDEVAHAAGTIGYELMCALALRVPVRVVDSAQDMSGSA